MLPLRCNASIFNRFSRLGNKYDAEDDALTSEEGEGEDKLMDFDHELLAARGYLRNQKSYTPPRNVVELIRAACVEAGGSESPDFGQKDVKFAVLARCARDLMHPVPNSLLHTIESADLLMEFYCTPVDVRVPLDRMKDINLPENLHVIYNYHRFNPETDTKFNGVSAFPGESNIITGLKAKKKYKGFVDEPEWAKYNIRVDANRHGIPKVKKRYAILENNW